MSSVVEQGAIRNVIRGIDDVQFHIVLFEPIDDREHSKSKKVFIDFKIRDKIIIIGYENSATNEQINSMVKWHSTQGIHVGDAMATAGTGLKYYEYMVRGEQTHITYNFDSEGNKYYIESSANTAAIFNAARDTSISEGDFNEINKRNTFYAKTIDETTHTLNSLFENAEGAYPFSPKTLFVSKKISNEKLLKELNDKDYIEILRREINNKYYHEIASGDLELYIKYPTSDSFEIVNISKRADTIGLVEGCDKYVSSIYEIKDNYECEKALSKGDYVFNINNKFFHASKNGNSAVRTYLPSFDVSKSIKCFDFNQFKIPSHLEEAIKEYGMTSPSMESYCGIYLMIGGKLINSRPMPSNLLARNQEGSKMYRGCLSICPENAIYIKQKLRLNGLKATFNLADNIELDFIVRQLAHLYKKYSASTEPDKDTNPENYVCVKTSNEKAKVKEQLGVFYVLKVGPNFYKLGISGTSGKAKRIFNYFKTEDDLEKEKESFPDEEFFEKSKIHYVYLSSYDIKNSASLEQQVKEYLIELDDVILYKNKKGDSNREYFHCECLKTIENIKEFIIKNSKY
jgi:hypothetical protein